MSAFIQTVVHSLTPDLKIVPGVRLEHYRISRFTRALTEEEGEGEEIDDCLGDEGVPINGECTEIEGFSTPFNSESFTRTNVLPHLSFAWSGLNKSTVYGGYHQGLTMHVLREEVIPPGEEVGDNFQLGFKFKGNPWRHVRRRGLLQPHPGLSDQGLVDDAGRQQRFQHGRQSRDQGR